MVGSWRDRGDRLFGDKKDHERFRQRLAEGVKEAGIGLYLFCQMSNHFHLVLETPQTNLSRFRDQKALLGSDINLEIKGLLYANDASSAGSG